MNNYDVIIAGSGLGGSACAYSLAKAGFKVLLLERGSVVKEDDKDWDGKEILVDKRYRGPVPLMVKQYGQKRFSELYHNEVLGGMSVFYGAAVLRMREEDFEKWPVKYKEMEPYYTEAEELMEVHGEAGKDPGETYRSKDYPFSLPPYTEPAERIYRAAVSLDYRPFKLPLTINFSNSSGPLCTKCNTCDGFPCKIGAKNDASKTFLKKAKTWNNLEVRTGVIAKRVIKEGNKIKALECIDKKTGENFTLTGRIIILSGGAIESPAILMRSGLDKYNALTGKNLMRHCNAIVSNIFPFRTNPGTVFHKQIGISDFYEDLRHKYETATGIIQDIYTPPAEVIRHFAPLGLKTVAATMSGYLQNLLCIAEDEPLKSNQVTLSKKRDIYGMEIVRVEHRYTGADCIKRDYLIQKAEKILRRAGGVFTKVVYIDSFSHAVGTLRFGHSPSDSVLDKNCRFFGTENLFVLDGSFMPTSSGVNPGLTIAANSLRVADYIKEKFR